MPARHTTVRLKTQAAFQSRILSQSFLKKNKAPYILFVVFYYFFERDAMGDDTDSLIASLSTLIARHCTDSGRICPRIAQPTVRRNETVVRIENVEGLDLGAFIEALPKCYKVFLRNPSLANELESRIDVYIPREAASGREGHSLRQRPLSSILSPGCSALLWTALIVHRKCSSSLC